MRDVETRTIGAFQYRIKQLADPHGWALLVRLMQTILPTIGAGLKGLPESGEGIGLQDLTTGAIGEALIALSGNVSVEDMEFIYSTLASSTEISTDGANWFPLASDKAHWRGRYMDKLKFILAALEVNYSDFLGGSDSINRVAALLRGRQSKSPSSSTGEQSESSPASTTPSAGGN